MKRLSCKHAQNLGLGVHAHGGDLVHEERAAVGDFKEPLFGGDGRGEGAFDVAEERGFKQFRGHGAGIDGNKRLVFARRVGVDGFGDQLLAGSALALNQNGGAAGRNLSYEVEDLEHDFAFAYDVLEVIALLEGALELEVFFLGLAAGDGGADVGEQLFVVPGLLDKVLGAGADRIDDVVDGAVGGNHDDRQFGMALFDDGQQLQAALSGQRQIEQQQVEALLLQRAQSLFAIDGHGDRVAFQREQHLQRLADGRLVVNDQDARQTGVAGGSDRQTDSRADRPQA